MWIKIIILTGLLCFWIARKQTGKRDKFNTGLWDYSWILAIFTLTLWIVLSAIEFAMWLVYVGLGYL